MNAVLVTVPCLVAVVAVMGLRRSGLEAALLAWVSSLGLWGFGSFTPPRLEHLVHAFADASVLLLLVGIVVFLGLVFVQIGNRAGGLEAIRDIVRSMNLPESRTLIVIVLGIGVTVESLTGFGVSMMVTLPLLLPMVSRTRAIALALLGMSLMPWGALSIATLLGAEIARMPVPMLANAMLSTSGPVAAMLPVCCLLLATRRNAADWMHALLCSAVLLGGIVVTTRFVGVEVAGVGGGLAVLVFSWLRARSTRSAAAIVADPALAPYGLLIAAIVLQKLLVRPLHDAGFSLELNTGRVAFDLLASPGLALAFASLAAMWLQRRGGAAIAQASEARHVVLRASRALAGIGLFLVTARLLIEMGGVASVTTLLTRMSLYGASSLTVLMGGFGAYATGSGVTSNALFMASAASAGDAFQARALFAALQTSSAGHAAMASLPIISVLLAALPTRQRDDERIAMLIGSVMVLLWSATVATSGIVQLATRS